MPNAGSRPLDRVGGLDRFANPGAANDSGSRRRHRRGRRAGRGQRQSDPIRSGWNFEQAVI